MCRIRLLLTFSAATLVLAAIIFALGCWSDLPTLDRRSLRDPFK